MSKTNTAPKKKARIGNILLWILVILVALHIYTDGESTDALLRLFDLEDIGSSYTEQSPPYLGVEVLNTYDKSGAFVLGVDAESPAEVAGVLTGDTIISIGHCAITSAEDVVSALASFYPGDVTRITVQRGNDQLVFDVTLNAAVQNTTNSSNQEADRLPSVPDGMRDHVYLNMRDWGYCEKLTGNVIITFLFVNDPEATWSDAQISTMKADLQAVADRIESDATGYGAHVNITLQYKTCSTAQTIVDGDFSQWMDSALASAGLPDRTGINTHLENIYGCDSTPVVFLANHAGRAKAVSHSSKNEFAILYQDSHAFYHELCHIYGAKDFYYPADVKTLAETYLTDSLMVNSSEGKMDDFTAYLIGWTDSLSDNALQFLKDTAHLTKDYLASEHEKETYTGYVTDYTATWGIYTGYLVDGIRHGEGKWISNFGYTQEGTFVHGSLHGYGTCRYDNGNTYAGNWNNGTWNGHGTFTWGSGDKYSGDRYVGEFADGYRHGYGIYYYANGNRYEGNWSNGERHGQGTYYYSDGTSKSGTWSDGNYQG